MWRQLIRDSVLTTDLSSLFPAQLRRMSRPCRQLCRYRRRHKGNERDSDTTDAAEFAKWTVPLAWLRLTFADLFRRRSLPANLPPSPQHALLLAVGLASPRYETSSCLPWLTVLTQLLHLHYLCLPSAPQLPTTTRGTRRICPASTLPHICHYPSSQQPAVM